MAGLGAKLFTAFSKLTAAQVQGYLADQAIMRFANAAARDAAFGGAGEPTLAEGMTCYLDDTNEIQSYNGSAWVGVAASSTVSNVSSGLVYIKSQTIGSAVSSVNVTSAFSSTYDHYKILIAGGTASQSAELNMTIGATVTNYHYQFVFTAWNTSVSCDASKVGTKFAYVGSMNTTGMIADITVLSPNLAANTRVYASGVGDAGSYVGNSSGLLINTTQYTDFTITPNAGTMTGGTITVYGYRKA
jgi:hypothetical protein